METVPSLANPLLYAVRSAFIVQGFGKMKSHDFQWISFLNNVSVQSGGESIDVNQIRSVKVSRGARNIPKAFEIFTGDQTLILKPKDGKNAEEWVQCLSIVVAHSQVRTKYNNIEKRKYIEISSKSHFFCKIARILRTFRSLVLIFFRSFLQARDNPTVKTNSLPARGLGNSRSAF